MNKGIKYLVCLLVMLLVTLAAAGLAEADVAINEENFPDANFRQFVLDEGYDTDGDGNLHDTELSRVTQMLCKERSISDLKGIEYFTSLIYLDCSYNQLTSLDVSKNTALTNLVCDDNQLAALDVSCNTALYYLSCSSNQLTSLIIGSNTSLRTLYCSCNRLAALDISKNPALATVECYANQLTDLDVSNNAALTMLSCSENSLTSLDTSRNPALLGLYCHENQLTSLDVSQNTALEILYCSSNKLTDLDVSRNTAMTELYCNFNQLSVLDVSRNTLLTALHCFSNQLTSLDVSNNTALTKLLCFKNKLTSLDVSNCAVLCALVRDSSRCIYPEGYDMWGSSFEKKMLSVDPTVTVTAGDFVSDPTVQPEPEPETEPQPLDISKAKISSIKDQAYTGKALKPAVTVKLDGKKLNKGTDYKVSYKNNKKIGTATVTVTGIGSYTGSVKATFNIVPKKVTLSSVKAGSKKLTVKWKKGSGVSGYEIEYALKKNFKGAKRVTVKKAATTGTDIKKLTKGKTYYVRIRAYKTVKSKNYFSAWSKTLKAKVK